MSAAPPPPPHTGRTPRGARGRPATSDIDYTADEAEYMAAVEAWKKRTGRKFPTHSEMLAIARGLGYRKAGEGGAA